VTVTADSYTIGSLQQTANEHRSAPHRQYRPAKEHQINASSFHMDAGGNVIYSSRKCVHNAQYSLTL
jgi:hypothetical protein